MFAYLVYIQYFSPRPPAKTLSSIKQVSQFENHQARSGIEVTGLKISWQVSDFIFTWLAESWKAAMVMYGSHSFLIHFAWIHKEQQRSAHQTAQQQRKLIHWSSEHKIF